jgi:hypothetical protein
MDSYYDARSAYANYTGTRYYYFDDVSHQHSKTTDYWGKKARGEYIPPLPYYARQHKREIPICYMRPVWPQYEDTFESLYGAAEVHSWASLDVASKFRDELSDNDLNLAMVWFERKDTFRMIASKAALIAKAARDVRRGKFKRASKTLGVTLSQRKHKRLRKRDRLDQFSDNWLEYSYGWAPLIGDIYQASKLISDGFNYGDDIVEFRKTLFDERVHDKNNIWWSSSVGKSKASDVSGTSLYRKTLKVRYKVTDPDFRVRDALGLTNPALVAWEVIPFSFVVDWFIPVGDFLRDLTLFQGLTFHSGYISTKREYDITIGSALGPWGYDLDPKTGEDFVYHNVWREFDRTILTSFDSLRHNPWSTGNGLSPRRALSAITLAQGRLRGRNR